MKVVMVSYLERNRIVKIPDDCDGKELEDLEKEFREKFSYQGNLSISISFHKFDPDWEDYVEVEKGSIIENKDKLKVVVVPQIISPRQSAESSIYGDSGSVEMPGLSSTPSGSSKHRPRVITDDDMSFDIQRLPRRGRLPVISDDESASYGSTAIDPEDNISDFETVKPKKRKVVKDLDDAVPLPSPYPLPSHYSSSVETALKEGRLSHVTRQAFLSSVASSMLSYKRYPTYEDYFNVAHTIIQKYPFMKSPIGSPTGAIVTSLNNSFKEFRRDREKKRKSASPRPPSEVKKLPGSRMKLSNTAKAVVSSGEDEVSFLRNIKVLQSEHKKTNHNQQVVNELMSSTFSMRRQDITENPRSVQTLFEKYPFLNDVEQLMLEMCRIADDEEWNVKGEIKWTDIQMKILKQATLEAAHNKKLREKLEEVDSDNCNNSLLAIITIAYLLPDRTKPESDKLIYLTNGATNLLTIISEKKQPQPYVIVTGNMNAPEQAFLVVDCHLMGEISLETIPLYIVAAYFVFNICYIKGCHNVFAFFEANFCSVSCNVPSTVQHFMAALNNISL